MPAATIHPELADASAQLRERLAALPSSGIYTDDEVESLYAIGYQMAAQGRHAQALESFTLAATFKPANLKYLRALAITLSELGRHDHAQTLYRVLDALDPCNPGTVLSMAECALHMRDAPMAVDLLEQVIEYCEQHGQTGATLDKARSLLELLGNRKERSHAG